MLLATTAWSATLAHLLSTKRGVGGGGRKPPTDLLLLGHREVVFCLSLQEPDPFGDTVAKMVAACALPNMPTDGMPLASLCS